MIAAGKEGKVYLLDRDKLGHYTVGSDAVVSTLVGGIGGSLSTPAYFNGHIYWTSGYSNTARELTIAADGTMSITSGTAATFGYLPGSAVVSANGTTNGVVWVMDTASNKIHAYDANTFATELWNSGQKAGGADNLGAAIKFATPAVVNGEVYVGTSNSLVVYGLTPPATQVPNTPVLTAATLSGSSVSLTWTDSSVAPNLASSYLVEQSLDGTTFTQVTTAPAGSLGISIGGLNTTTKYYFRVRSQNGVGYSNYSNIASATTTNQVALLDFTGGFVSSTSLLAYNGIAAINSSKAELTNGGTERPDPFFPKTLSISPNLTRSLRSKRPQAAPPPTALPSPFRASAPTPWAPAAADWVTDRIPPAAPAASPRASPSSSISTAIQAKGPTPPVCT